MSGKKKSPPAGSVFLVPLRDSGYATGVMARTRRDGVCLGYFFGPRLADATELDMSRLVPSYAMLVGIFGDLDILLGTWSVVGKIEPWDPRDWPVPQMARVNEIENRAWLSTYDEQLLCVDEEEITPEQAREYHYDSMMGSGAVEIVLTKRLR